MPPSARAPRLAVLVALVGAVALMTWPAPQALVSGELLGHATGDLADHVQGAWAFVEDLRSGRDPLRTHLSHYPTPLPLWFVDPLGALLGAAGWRIDAARSWDLVLLAQVFLATAVAYGAGRDLTGARSAGLLTAAIAGPSPYLLSLLHSGLSEMVGLAPLIGAIWASLRATGRDPRGRPAPRWMAPLAGLLIGLCAWQAFYYAAFAGLFLLCCVPGRGLLARLRPVAIAGAGALVVAAPALALLWGTLRGAGGAVGEHNAPGWASGGPPPATDLLTFLRPGAYYFPDTPALGNPGILHVNYLGWVALLLALLALLRPRSAGPRAAPLALPAALYGLLMLGPGLVLGGRHLGLPLPLALLYLGPSPFALVHHPYRMVAVGMVLLGLLAGLASLRLSPALRLLLAGAVLAETALLSPAPWPLQTTPLPGPAAWQERPRGGSGLAPDATAQNRRYQLAQLRHGRAVPYGVNVFLPDALAEDALVNGLLRDLDDPRARARNRDVPARRDPVPAARPGPSQLAEWGFGALILHRDALSPAEWARADQRLRAAWGPPTRTGSWGAAWTLRR